MNNGPWKTLGNNPHYAAETTGKWGDFKNPKVEFTVKPVTPEDIHKAQLRVVTVGRACGLSNAEIKEALDALGIGERVENDGDHPDC